MDELWNGIGGQVLLKWFGHLERVENNDMTRSVDRSEIGSMGEKG